MPTLLWSTQTRMTSADSMLHSREDMSYEEYVEIHSRCMRQLGLSVSDSTITCLQVKQMMGKLMMMVIHVGPGNHLGQQTHGFWAKSGLCSNTLNNCFNQEVGDEKSILELEFLI
ncbi:unnamed protein product [Brassica napus]|uniref:(rape) hypothetical protein n=1 Tax=Brassica napus TaxID=3708 RepID=A0A816XMZ0_BRANA|nr:unnamed protein product [Brassica napus]